MKAKKIITLIILSIMMLQSAVLAAPYANMNAPGIIEAENYDTDGQGVSYGDSDAENMGGVYRQDAVDIYSIKTGGNYVLMTQNEWLKYTFYTDREGSYEVILNALVPDVTVKANLYIDDMKICEAKSNATAKNTFVDVSIANVYLREGTHTIAIENKGGDIQLNYLQFKHTTQEGIKTWGGEKTVLSLPTYVKKGSELGFPHIDFRNKNNEVSSYLAEIYVAVDGNDANDGSKEKPFKTVQRAVEETRKYNKNMTDNVKVNIGSGRHYITEAITLGMEDTASNGFEIIYEGAADGSTIIDGGVPYTFTKVEGKPLWVTDIASDSHIYEFYVNDHRAKVASTEYEYWPRASTSYIDEETGAKTGVIFDKKQMPLEIDDPDGMIIWACFEWVPQFSPVDKFMDKGDSVVVTIKGEYAYKNTSILSGNYGMVLRNHISFLDNPGEFYYDKKAQKLYYYPFEGEKIEDAVGYLPKASQLVNISGEDLSTRISGITFKNINFKHGIWEDPWVKGHSPGQAGTYSTGETGWYSHWNNLIPAMFYVNYAENVNVTGCSFENLSPTAVHYRHAVENCDIVGNTFYDVGAEAVMLGDGYHCTVAGQAHLAPKYINIDNNLIRESGQIYYGSPAITAFYVNNTSISHNDIDYVPYSGISIGWGWGNNSPEYSDCTIANNKISNVMHTAWDGSHIYTLGDSPRTVISGNYLTRTDEHCGGGTLYFDQGSANYTTMNNVFENQRTWTITWGNDGTEEAKNTIGTIKHFTNYAQQVKKHGWRGNNPTAEQLEQFIEVGVGNEWPEAAKKIIKNAGLRGEYKVLLENFEKRDIVENIFTSRLDPYVDEKLYLEILPGRDFIRGEEGVTYHDVDLNNDSDGYENGPDWGSKYYNIGYNGPPDFEWMTFKLKTDKTGDYTVILGGNTGSTGGCNLYLDGELVIENGVIQPTAGGYKGRKYSELGTMHLEAGKEYILKYEFCRGAVNFAYLGFALNGDEVFCKDARYSELTD